MTHDDWDMEELRREVLDERLRRIGSEDDEQQAIIDTEYQRHPYEFWERRIWLWRIAMLIALCALVWAAFTDKRIDNVTPTPTPQPVVIVTTTR